MRKQFFINSTMMLMCLFSTSVFAAEAFPYRIFSETTPSEEVISIESFPDTEHYRYQLDKLIDYREFAILHPEFELSEVIWRVNAGLNHPFYETVFEYPDDVIDPLLVNKYYKLPSNFRPWKLVALPSGQMVTPETKDAFVEMSMDAADEGQNLALRSAYRSINDQAYIYSQYLKEDSQEKVDVYSARSGHSEHHTGRAIDLCGVQNRDFSAFEKTSESLWINENAWKYGFIVRYSNGTADVTGYKYEPWHITYVGKEISIFMHENKIATLEEYVFKWTFGELIDLKK